MDNRSTEYRPTYAPTTGLPFPALVGLDEAQQALLLLAVDPQLGGVALAASAGTGKSSLARGMRQLLTEDEIPFVEVPTSIDVENLLGGLDLEATLRTGRVVLQRGVLGRADGGIVYIDGLNLLSDGAANLLLSVMDQGEAVVEREGLSLRTPAHFRLLASYDPAEGEPRQHLLDRIGLLLTLPNRLDAARRADVIRHNLHETAARWDEELAFMRGLIETAREQLPNVTIGDRELGQLAVLALKYGVEGHRVDLFAVRTACAAAALALRDEVIEEDLLLAAKLVILPRATQMPTEETHPEPPPPPTPPQPPEQTNREPEPDRDDENQDTPPPEPAGLPPLEQIFEALESELPTDIEEMTFGVVRKGRAGSRGATAGNRGRHIRSVAGDPRRGRIDLVATLRTAAPWQPLRAAEAAEKGEDERPIHLRQSDIRIKQYRSKAGALFCFAVDASGSMALHRMRQAKGAVQTLLQKAYVNRDRVALIAFRGEEADLLLPPTQSVELARRTLDLLPTGGGTPLASALLLAEDVAQQAAGRGIHQTVLIVLTDGRGNVPLTEGGNPKIELEQVGAHLAGSPLRIVIVDTQRSYLSRGEAKRLAGWVGGEYAYLPNANSEDIATLASNMA